MAQPADKGYSYEQALLKKCSSLRLRRMICMKGSGMNLSHCGHNLQMSPCDKTIKPSGPIKGRKFTDEMDNYYWLLIKGCAAQSWLLQRSHIRCCLQSLPNGIYPPAPQSSELLLLEILNHNDLLNCH